MNQPISPKEVLSSETAVVKKVERNNPLFWILVGAAMLALILLSLWAKITPYSDLDQIVTEHIQQINVRSFDLFMRFLTFLGYPLQVEVSYTVSIIFLLIIKKYKEAFFVGFTVGATILATIIKHYVGRARPAINLVHVTTMLKDKSFPSGHTTFFVAFYGFLIFLTFVLLKPSWIRNLLIIVMSIFILFIGVSRIYLGNHWLSDVVGGYILGGLWLALTIHLYRRQKLS